MRMSTHNFSRRCKAGLSILFTGSFEQRSQHFNKIRRRIQAGLFRDNGNRLLGVHHLPNSAHHKGVIDFILAFYSPAPNTLLLPAFVAKAVTSEEQAAGGSFIVLREDTFATTVFLTC